MPVAYCEYLNLKKQQLVSLPPKNSGDKEKIDDYGWSIENREKREMNNVFIPHFSW